MINSFLQPHEMHIPTGDNYIFPQAPLHVDMVHMYPFIQQLMQPLPQQQFEDVVVTLDESELSKLKTFKLEAPLESNCSICMEHMLTDNIITELNCSHTFHSDCIGKYLKEYSYKCPICRADVGQHKYSI